MFEAVTTSYGRSAAQYTAPEEGVQVPRSAWHIGSPPQTCTFAGVEKD